jgi:hypothetical protein
VRARAAQPGEDRRRGEKEPHHGAVASRRAIEEYEGQAAEPEQRRQIAHRHRLLRHEVEQRHVADLELRCVAAELEERPAVARVPHDVGRE